MLLSDKLNSVDYQWFLVRTKPGHEPELCAHIGCEKDRIRNILEVYCPTHTKVYVRRGDNERRLPLFDGYVRPLAPYPNPRCALSVTTTRTMPTRS